VRDIEDGLIHELQADDGHSWKWHCEQKDKEIEQLKNELNTANLWCHIAEMKVDEVLPLNARLRGLLRDARDLLSEVGSTQLRADKMYDEIQKVLGDD
jgi:hypothetical protein